MDAYIECLQIICEFEALGQGDKIRIVDTVIREVQLHQSTVFQGQAQLFDPCVRIGGYFSIGWSSRRD